jgi:hypothetical protein
MKCTAINMFGVIIWNADGRKLLNNDNINLSLRKRHCLAIVFSVMVFFLAGKNKKMTSSCLELWFESSQLILAWLAGSL